MAAQTVQPHGAGWPSATCTQESHRSLVLNTHTLSSVSPATLPPVPRWGEADPLILEMSDGDKSLQVHTPARAEPGLKPSLPTPSPELQPPRSGWGLLPLGLCGGVFGGKRKVQADSPSRQQSQSTLRVSSPTPLGPSPRHCCPQAFCGWH